LSLADAKALAVAPLVQAPLSATAFHVAMVLAFGTRFPLAAFLAVVALIDIMVSAF